MSKIEILDRRKDVAWVSINGNKIHLNIEDAEYIHSLEKELEELREEIRKEIIVEGTESTKLRAIRRNQNPER